MEWEGNGNAFALAKQENTSLYAVSNLPLHPNL
jgi:hypothetical protein